MSLQLKVKVIPGAARESVEWFGEGLKIKVRVAPEKGRANAAVAALLAERLQVPVSSVQVYSGFTTPHKTLSIEGLDLDELRRRLP